MTSPCTKKELTEWIEGKFGGRAGLLFEEARLAREKHVGGKVYFRGVIELSNVCVKNCFYCGIRSGNGGIKRYTMGLDEVIDCARRAMKSRYGSVVLQSGERNDREFTSFITRAVSGIRALSGGGLGITLSMGEQDESVYREWFDAGARRYLLRIETSNPELYGKLHPAGHSFRDRMACLGLLKKAGYQVGTGAMIGLPGQTAEDMAGDILFYKDIDADMIGMGPYLPRRGTPLETAAANAPGERSRLLRQSLTMIALARLVLKDVNIAATTALQALDPNGREMGIQAGANIIMPSITPREYRPHYLLYDGKPCVEEDIDDCRGCLDKRIGGIAGGIGYGERGDPPHFRNRLVRPG